jgi:hypothetical protein
LFNDFSIYLYVFLIIIYVISHNKLLRLNREIAVNKQNRTLKWTGILTLVLSLGTGVLLQAPVPVMADAATPVTITLLSGSTTQTAGYTYSNPCYKTTTYASGTNTETAGFTHTSPAAAPLTESSYSGTWSPAQVVDDPSPWTTIGSANWVSTTAANGGVENANEGDTWRLYRTTFNVTNPAAVTSASIQIAADNAYEFYFNGILIDSTTNWDPAATVYGASHEPGGSTAPFGQPATHALTLQSGTNTLMVVVRNWDNISQGNPSGLAYKVTLNYGTLNPLTPASYSGGGSWTNAAHVTDLPGSWVQPAWGAYWVSTRSENSGIDDPDEGEAWRLYKDEFTIPAGAAIDSASIQIAGDNAYEVYLNGTSIGTTADLIPACTVYGDSPEPNGSMIPFTQAAAYAFTPQTGTNTLMLVVRNWGDGGGNPTGLLYKASITYSVNNNFTITANADSGGSISPSGEVSINDNADHSFTITANPGYFISNVTVDGVSQGVITNYTFHSVTANHIIDATFYTTTIAGTTGNVNVPAGQTNYIVNAAAVAQTTVTVSTNGPVDINVQQYSGNPHPEASPPANMLPVFKDIIVGDLNAVIWPMHVEIAYTDAGITGTIESSLRMYYFKNGAWHLCSDTGVNTTGKFVWANMTRDECTGSPLVIAGDSLSSPQAVGGTVFPVNKLKILAPWLSLLLGTLLVLAAAVNRIMARIRA